jgi:hypothetical protein
MLISISGLSVAETRQHKKDNWKTVEVISEIAIPAISYRQQELVQKKVKK